MHQAAAARGHQAHPAAVRRERVPGAREREARAGAELSPPLSLRARLPPDQVREAQGVAYVFLGTALRLPPALASVNGCCGLLPAHGSASSRPVDEDF